MRSYGTKNTLSLTLSPSRKRSGDTRTISRGARYLLFVVVIFSLFFCYSGIKEEEWRHKDHKKVFIVVVIAFFITLSLSRKRSGDKGKFFF